MPLFNKEKEVALSIESVLNQTIKTWELIIINDGSTDKSVESIKTFNDDRIKLIEQENLGVSAARNNAIQLAENEHIAFLDADDTWQNNYLELITEMISNYPTAGIWATNYFIIKNGLKSNPKINGLKDPHLGPIDNYFKIACQSDPPLWTSAVTVNKKSILSIGGFPSGIITGEDLLTWAKMASQFEIIWNSIPSATFNAPSNVNDRIGRKPQIPDTVANELNKLKTSLNPLQIKYLKHYIFAWHKMRANIYLQLNDRLNSFKELKLMITSIPFHKKNIVYLIAILTPNFILKKLLNK